VVAHSLATGDPTDIVTIMGASVSTYSGHLQSLGITVDWKYQTEAKLCCFDKASRADHHMAIVVAHYLMRSPQTKPNLLRSVVEKKGSNKFARRRLAHWSSCSADASSRLSWPRQSHVCRMAAPRDCPSPSAPRPIQTCFLRLQRSMGQQRKEFVESGKYANTSFEEVRRSVGFSALSVQAQGEDLTCSIS
jgi:hypothetical protein